MGPQSYTVQGGDTLSAIGAKYGVDYNTITGYKSGNPNLIYPGEVLSIPGKGGGAAPSATPAAPVTNPVSYSTPQPQTQPQAQPQNTAGGALTADILRSKFGFNDPNVINNILNDPGQVARYTQEAGLGGGNSNPVGIGANNQPTLDLVKITNDAYNTPEIQAAQKAITDRQQALADRSSEINDNPFYSEASRTGKLAQLTSQANADIKVQQDQLAMLNAKAQVKVNAAQGQYNINNAAYQTQLQQFNNLLQAGALTNASPQDLANYSIQTGIPISELQSIQTKQQNDNVKTALVTSDDGTISVLNTNTGQVISQSKPGLGQVTQQKQTTPTATSVAINKQETISGAYSDLSRLADPITGFVSKEDWAKVKKNALNQGLKASEFDTEFRKTFTNPDNGNGTYNYN